jgi:hypothetical protein
MRDGDHFLKSVMKGKLLTLRELIFPPYPSSRFTVCIRKPSKKCAFITQPKTGRSNRISTRALPPA